MQNFHEKTNITTKNSFEQTQFIDWRTQPKDFKTYPKFFRRFSLDDYEELKFIKNFGKITYTKKYADQIVHLRTNPSAGGLYPCEIYIQIRGIKGVLPGIYHYEPLDNSLVLIHELSSDGLEYYFSKNEQQKFIFLISNVYFRSSWKYDKRAIRYLLLDTGHQLGSIYAALKLEEKEFKIEFDFDKQVLNQEFGFDGFEFFQLSILSDIHKQKEIKKLREQLVNVSACDYQKKEQFIEEFINNSYSEENSLSTELNFLNDLKKHEIQYAIDNRRSIRAFKNKALSKDELDFIVKDVLEFTLKSDIEIYIIVNNIEGVKKGSYKNVSLLKEGSFSNLSTKLAFNQKLGGTSAFTLFFTSKSSKNYVQNYILSGFLAHIINLKSSHLGIGCSGIGAYFDDECQNFFETKNNFLYLQAVGR